MRRNWSIKFNIGLNEWSKVKGTDKNMQIQVIRASSRLENQQNQVFGSNLGQIRANHLFLIIYNYLDYLLDIIIIPTFFSEAMVILGLSVLTCCSFFSDVFTAKSTLQSLDTTSYQIWRLANFVDGSSLRLWTRVLGCERGFTLPE